jgi:hypothetical protein
MNGSKWEWLLPAVIVLALFVASAIFQEVAAIFLPGVVYFACQSALVVGMVFAAIGAASAYHNWRAWEETQRNMERRRLEAITPVTLMADALKMMHPEAVRALSKFGIKTIWELAPSKDEGGDVDWILSNTSVRAEFIAHVLDKSSAKYVMSKRTLSEGAFKFDPDMLVTDYEQYDQLLAWWKGRMMVTEPFGNLPAGWMPPWNPERVKAKMGLNDSEEPAVAELS